MFTDDFLLLRYLCTSEYSLGARGFLREESQSGDKRNGEEREESFVSPLLSLSSFITAKETSGTRVIWVDWRETFCGNSSFADCVALSLSTTNVVIKRCSKESWNVIGNLWRPGGTMFQKVQRYIHWHVMYLSSLCWFCSLPKRKVIHLLKFHPEDLKNA